jgi:hypothetical protein
VEHQVAVVEPLVLIGVEARIGSIGQLEATEVELVHQAAWVVSGLGERDREAVELLRTDDRLGVEEPVEVRESPVPAG